MNSIDVVELLFALTVPFRTAELVVTELAADVVTVGAGVVVKNSVSPVVDPDSFVATTL
jgi:hypothetical protein